MQGPEIPIHIESEDYRAQDPTPLTANGCVTQLNSLYEEVLEEVVFPSYKVELLLKPLCSHANKLREPESHDLLLTIWKESSFYTDHDLHLKGIDRIFSGSPVTVYGLAVEAADGARELNALTMRFTAITKAAEAFGLIKIDCSVGNKRPIEGTFLLHTFLTTLGKRRAKLIMEVARSMALHLDQLDDGRL